MITATMKIEKTYTEPTFVIADIFRSHIDEVEDAGVGMYNLYINLMGIECIVQSYPIPEDSNHNKCYILFTNMNEADDTEYCELGQLPRSLQWAVAMNVAKHFNTDLNIPYFDYSKPTFCDHEAEL